MHSEVSKRKLISRDPWEREPKEIYTSEELYYLKNYALKRPKFLATGGENMYLDIYTKRAAMRASPSVVSLRSYSGEEELFEGSGTIIHVVEDGDHFTGIILTAATLIRRQSNGAAAAMADNLKVDVYLWDGKSFEGQILVHDFHYNLAVIKIRSDTPVMTANMKRLDDSINVNPTELEPPDEKIFHLRPHSTSFKLIPGDTVIALGRHFTKPYDLMAATGKFSVDRSEYDCKELLRAHCRITRCGIGGPLINRYGEVIGVAFHDLAFTPFLPINMAIKWWEHYSKYGKLRRPWLGMEVTNLYTADLDILEKIIHKFPNIFKGVIVEEVIPGSSANSAGICRNDVIVQCNGKAVQSFLELFEVIWDKVGEPVEFLVIRASADIPLSLSMVVMDTTPDGFYSWPLWDFVR